MRATGLRGGKPADPSVPSPPPRRSPCSSIRKGVPLYGWKNRGEAPRRWLLSEQRLGGFGPGGGAAQAQAGPPPPRASLPGNGPPPPPPLEISGQVHRVPGLLSELREALPATHRTKRFPPWTTRPSSSPTPAEAECPGRTRDVGPGRGAGKRGRPRFRARWSGSGRADPWSTDRFSRRESGLCPCWEAKSLASPATPPPCHKAADLDPAASTLQSLLNHPKMECDRCDLSPPELQPPPL